jgi:HPt (histidine-containing phosphotransfer) domain-containing protein
MDRKVMDDLPVQDQTVLEALLRYGPPSFLVQLIQVYLETTPVHVDNAEASFAAGDWKALTFAAHSLKSSAGNLGLPRMLDTVKMLELAARSKDVDEARLLVAGLRKTWSDSCAALEEYRSKL